MKTLWAAIMTMMPTVSLAWSLSGSPTEASFIFKLGTSLVEVQKDPRAKSCKDMGATDDTGKPLKEGRYFNCKNVEKVSELNLLFFAGKLIQVAANFHEDSPDGLNRAITLASVNQSTNQDTDPILTAAKSKCEALGKTEKKNDNHNVNSKGVVVDQFSEKFQNSDYFCGAFYTVVDKKALTTKEPYVLTVADMFLLRDLKAYAAAQDAQKKQAASEYKF